MSADFPADERGFVCISPISAYNISENSRENNKVSRRWAQIFPLMSADSFVYRNICEQHQRKSAGKNIVCNHFFREKYIPAITTSTKPPAIIQ